MNVGTLVRLAMRGEVLRVADDLGPHMTLDLLRVLAFQAAIQIATDGLLEFARARAEIRQLIGVTP